MIWFIVALAAAVLLVTAPALFVRALAEHLCRPKGKR